MTDLVPCPDCRAEVSKRAPACPQCGCPLKSNWGKPLWKMGAIMIALDFAIGMFVYFGPDSLVNAETQYLDPLMAPLLLRPLGWICLIVGLVADWKN